MMKVRTMNPPARTASGTTSQQEIPRHRYIKYQSAKYGPSVSTNCHIARPVEAF